MKQNIIFSLIAAAAFFSAGPAWAAMGSAHYRITTSVMSGGGGTMSSPSYSSNSVLGQPTPINNPNIASGSPGGSYLLYPGYIHTVYASAVSCIWDNEPDGDVDGLDLYQFIGPYHSGHWDNTHLEGFSSEFGKDDCFE